MAYEAILRTLRRLDADIVLLQEVDRHCRRTGHRDIARDLAEALAMNWVAAGEFQEIGEGRDGRGAITGQAILQPVPDRGRARAALQGAGPLALVDQPGAAAPRRPHDADRAQPRPAPLRHPHRERAATPGCSVRRWLRSWPITRRKRHGLRQVPSRPGRALIAGDFNNGPVGHAPMFANLKAAAFTDALGAWTDRSPTSRGGRHPIDWIFVNGVTAFSGEGRVVDAASASDHSPVIAALSRSTTVALSR